MTSRRSLPLPVAGMAEALTSAPGDLAPELRRALLDRAEAITMGREPGAGVPEGLAPYVDKVTRWAYKVVDGDIDGLRAAGWSEDAIFEATLCAATGAGLARLRHGLALLDQGGNSATPSPA